MERIEAVLRHHLGRKTALFLTLGLRIGDERKIFEVGARPGKNPPGRSIYQIGSVTKTFTSSMAAMLAARDSIALDAPIVDHLPDPLQAELKGLSAITFAHLLTHTSGLPSVPDTLRVSKRRPLFNPYAGFTSSDLYRYLGTLKPKEMPPRPFAYSNLGMGWLADVLGQIEGVSYEQLVQRLMSQPLGLRDTRVYLDATQQDRLVSGHAATGWPAPCWDLPALAGAGALYSTAEDLMTYLDAQIEGHLPGVEQCHETRQQLAETTGIGLGWFISRFEGEALHWHNGGMGAYTSFTGFIKSKEISVCVLSNYGLSLKAFERQEDQMVDRIGKEALAIALKLN